MVDFSWKSERGAGVLLHISSLPSEFGVGNIGGAAKPFFKFLKDGGFSYWQMCPLNPTGYGDSPYQTFSLFAGNPYFIDIAQLRDLGLLENDRLDCLRALPRNKCDFGELYKKIPPILDEAFEKAKTEGFEKFAKRAGLKSFQKFCENNADWLEPYALYAAIKRELNPRAWNEWEDELKNYQQALKKKSDKKIANATECVKFVQWIFFEQFAKFKETAKEFDVEIFGDVPIFPAEDCADVWANPELFQLDKNGKPEFCAGVGPDYFSPKGQLWGNPLYDWKGEKIAVYNFWTRRLKAAFEMYDVIRLDHFRGFADYWAIPAKAKDASEGSMKKGPDVDFFEYIRKKFPTQKFVAEDLGLLSKLATDLRDKIKIPAMAVLQFAFGDSPKNPYLPHNVKGDCVYYTGTHDNDTALGWYNSASEKAKDEFRRYFRVSGEAANWDMICATLSNHARLAIFPMQDILGLGCHARFNTPGEPFDNWTWRMTDENFNSAKSAADYLKSVLTLTDRVKFSPKKEISKDVKSV